MHSSRTGTTSLDRAYVGAACAATVIFNLPEYRVLSATISALGIRRVVVESTGVPGCPTCGVIWPASVTA
ncbi:hypothetical protein [Arthrobacter sp. ISL-30]|uniref:hypothetical protein n=1 Tax=Arthrobacter sp. ISL-30 TaxID=2819109 RepID=UPI001BE7F5EA|nr:hypothetical protein [Arthrobacter sp. ISL-30]MBT2515803.1 hypothetical protein [Arthrobacter sp. ISL-30]